MLRKRTVFSPSDAQRIELRKAHLLEARASLKALDVRLTHCYLVMMQNPEGCFTTSKGKFSISEGGNGKAGQNGCKSWGND